MPSDHAIPSKVLALDPAWASCVAGDLHGFYDPPHTLTKAGSLDPATGISHDPSTIQPKPGPTPQPIIAPITAIASTSVPDPHSSQNTLVPVSNPSWACGPSRAPVNLPQPDPLESAEAGNDPGSSMNPVSTAQPHSDPSGANEASSIAPARSGNSNHQPQSGQTQPDSLVSAKAGNDPGFTVNLIPPRNLTMILRRRMESAQLHRRVPRTATLKLNQVKISLTH